MHIYEFQEMMKRLYFQRDFKRGVDGTFSWLTDELEELKEALKGTEGCAQFIFYSLSAKQVSERYGG
jgi:NTP pyrophosphatase (non-canonical NTP hydrolase)